MTEEDPKGEPVKTEVVPVPAPMPRRIVLFEDPTVLFKMETLGDLPNPGWHEGETEK